MKHLMSVLAILGLMLIVTGCGDSPKAVLNDTFDTLEGFMTDMEKAGSADDVVKAIESFHKKMLDLKPRVEKLQKEKPELFKGMKGGKMPEEFKEFDKRIEALKPKFMGIMQKMMKYASDPKVQEAQKKLEEAMKSMK